MRYNTDMHPIPFTVSNDSATVIFSGKPHTVKRGAPNFENLRKALLEERWSDVEGHLRADSSLEKWAKGKFKVVDGNVLFDGKPVDTELNNRIVEMAARGDDPTPLLKFWELLQQNPSHRSVSQLFHFLNHANIPLTSDGHFLAYKGVREDYMDCHSGTIRNKPGDVVTMPRNEISDDPDRTCHVGLHVGAYEYASSFGPKTVICKVSPADVVCVPNDYSYQKMRTCRYEVIGVHGDLLPSTTIDDDDVPQPSVLADKKRSKEFKRLDALMEAGLMKESTETLRHYASKGLNIVGASRIGGGKWALVQAIVSARY
jgi:hypothetical protein